MSLDKAIKHGKEKRKEYRGSARFDGSCRCGGSCSYCSGNRLFFDKKARAKVEGQVDEWFGHWNYPDGADVISDRIDQRLLELGVDPWDFQTRNELEA